MRLLKRNIVQKEAGATARSSAAPSTRRDTLRKLRQDK
jgi:hypothetical protein